MWQTPVIGVASLLPDFDHDVVLLLYSIQGVTSPTIILNSVISNRLLGIDTGRKPITNGRQINFTNISCLHNGNVPKVFFPAVLFSSLPNISS